jgi:hypothetical protein
MSQIPEHDPREGNYLQKSRHNVNITRRAWDLCHELSMDLGINHSNVFELAIREMYQKYMGPVKPIEPKVPHRDW